MKDTEPALRTAPAAPRLGLRENLPQFLLLVGINALVGGMIGQERTVLPLLANRTFGLTAYTATLTFIVAFGAVKAWTGFMIASNEIPADRRVDFDTTVDAMALTAKEMNSKYKETSEGGLAVSVVLC